MRASYDDNTAFAEDETGVPICYDWLWDQDGEAPPVRVQVKQAYVEKEWRLPWKEDAAVTQRFDALTRPRLCPGAAPRAAGFSFAVRPTTLAPCV